MNNRCPPVYRLSLLLALFLLAVTSSTNAWAQSRKSSGKPSAAAADNAGKAAAAKARGDAAMMDLNYGVALQAYADAYALSGDPALLYNQGRAEQARGDYAAALDFMERFSDKAPASLKAKVPGLDALVADLKSRVTTVTVTCDVDGAEVILRDTLLGTTPLAPARKLNAGPARILIREDGYLDDVRDVQLPGGGELTVDVKLHRKDESGVLIIHSAIAGVNVDVDGKPRGQVPLEVTASVGRHDLKLTRDGYQDSATSVVLGPTERKIIDVQLVKNPSILTRWWFWTGVGVVVAGGVTAYILATHERGADSGSIAPGRVSAPLVSF